MLQSRVIQRNKKKKSRLPIWNDKIQDSKRAHWMWKKAGRPRDPNNDYLRRKKIARRQMRLTIRSEINFQRDMKLNLIMETRESDSKVFFNTIKKQRTTRTSQTQVLDIDGCRCSTPEDVAHGFANHFEKLATPSTNDKYDSQYKELVTFDRLLIEDVCAMMPSSNRSVTASEVKKIFNSFKNNKAQDCISSFLPTLSLFIWPTS